MGTTASAQPPANSSATEPWGHGAWGERYWYTSSDGELTDRLAAGAKAVDPAEIVRSLGLPEPSCRPPTTSALIRAESDEALRRTGADVGTPIITYDPPAGNSLFGPVISAVPDDETAVAFYEALRTFADFSAFSELKRTNRGTARPSTPRRVTPWPAATALGLLGSEGLVQSGRCAPPYVER